MMFATSRWTRWLASLKRSWTEDCASQVVELALSLPLLVFFVVGIFDFSGALTLKQKLTNAAREGARVSAADPASDMYATVPVSVSDAVRSWITICILRRSTIAGWDRPGGTDAD